MKRLLFALIVVLLLLAVAMGVYWQRYQQFADTPLPGLPVEDGLLVERGDHLPSLLRKLDAQGVTTGDRLFWRLLAKQSGSAGKVQAGEYALPASLTPRELLLNMRDGKVVRRMFTLVDGWTMRDLRAALRNVPMLKQVTETFSDAEVMQALGQEDQHPEGRFLPETYAWVRGESDLDILRRAQTAMQKALDAAWDARAEGLPLSSKDEALILASIVEKETGVANERAQVAGVFTRRLKIGMRLQTDPTVIYGMGSSYAGNIRRSDLTTDTPYNTYTRNGLPPTPIAMPGKAALQAATQPNDTGALYFVAVGDGSGRHAFSTTLEQHNAAVRAYLQRYRANRNAERTEAATQ